MHKDQQKDGPNNEKLPISKSIDTSAFDYKKEHKSVTEGSVTVEGKAIDYKAVTGNLVLKNSEGEPTLSMFYTVYTKKGGDQSKRPITFIYNGGPGSATLWLHMGAFGPQKVFIKEEGGPELHFTQ